MADEIKITSTQLDALIRETIQASAKRHNINIDESTIMAFLERDTEHRGQALFEIDLNTEETKTPG